MPPSTMVPGISLSAVSEDGTESDLVRLALRTEGPQHRNLLTIPSPNFPNADKVKIAQTREHQGEAAAA